MRLNHFALVALVFFGCSKQTSKQQPAPVAPPPNAPAAPAVDTQRPSTTGAVHCGDQTCVVGESRCWMPQGGAPRCVSQSEASGFAQSGREEDAVIACDDASDCAEGEICCAGQYRGGTGPHMHLCNEGPCDVAIACAVPSDCPKGLYCKKLETGFGHCEVAEPGVQCGTSRCTGATPVCCWNPGTGKGRCIAEEGSEAACSGDDEERLRCRGKGDCGGYHCCVMMLSQTECHSTCPGPSLTVACQTMADCPPEGPGPAGMLQRYDACENGACTGKLCNPSGQWVPCDSL